MTDEVSSEKSGLNISGGDEVTIGGDVVGRDKITHQSSIGNSSSSSSANVNITLVLPNISQTPEQLRQRTAIEAEQEKGIFFSPHTTKRDTQPFPIAAVRIAALTGGDLDKGIVIGGNYRGADLDAIASNWVPYSEGNWVRSGWLHISGATISHAVAFFKVHLFDDNTGYIHILDAANPAHTIWLKTGSGVFHTQEFCWDGDPGVGRAVLWQFTW